MDGVIEILDFGFVRIVINAANGLKIPGFLEIHHVVVNAKFCPNWFVAYNCQLDYNRERIQNKQLVINVFRIVGDFGHLYIHGKFFLHLLSKIFFTTFLGFFVFFVFSTFLSATRDQYWQAAIIYNQWFGFDNFIQTY
jgi:hypothetical protein